MGKIRRLCRSNKGRLHEGLVVASRRLRRSNAGQRRAVAQRDQHVGHRHGGSWGLALRGQASRQRSQWVQSAACQLRLYHQ